MPDFHAVQCYECLTFQVQQVKKVAKFSCRLCGAKQSVRKVYAISCRAKDVRERVVLLNQLKGEAELELDETGQAEPVAAQGTLAASARHCGSRQNVQWDSYLEKEIEGLPEVADDGRVVATEVPDRQRKRRRDVSSAANAGSGAGRDAAKSSPRTTVDKHLSQWPARERNTARSLALSPALEDQSVCFAVPAEQTVSGKGRPFHASTESYAGTGVQRQSVLAAAAGAQQIQPERACKASKWAAFEEAEGPAVINALDSPSHECFRWIDGQK